MLRRVFLSALIGGITSPALAARVSLFDNLFGVDDGDFVDTGRQRTAAGKLSIDVDISRQRMIVSDAWGAIYAFDVSTGRKGYATPTGTNHPIRLERMWYSSQYENSPMPWSIFFHGGYAIHGTEAVRRLGHKASHGCVRLYPEDARALFELVEERGPKNTIIVIHV